MEYIFQCVSGKSGHTHNKEINAQRIKKHTHTLVMGKRNLHESLADIFAFCNHS